MGSVCLSVHLASTDGRLQGTVVRPSTKQTRRARGTFPAPCARHLWARGRRRTDSGVDAWRIGLPVCALPTAWQVRGDTQPTSSRLRYTPDRTLGRYVATVRTEQFIHVAVLQTPVSLFDCHRFPPQSAHVLQLLAVGCRSFVYRFASPSECFRVRLNTLPNEDTYLRFCVFRTFSSISKKLPFCYST